MIDELAEDIADDLADVFEADPRIQRQSLTRALEGDGSFRIVLLDPTRQSALQLVRVQS